MPQNTPISRYWRNAFACIAAFVAACVAIHTLSPQRNIGVLEPKLRYLAKNNDRFDTLFLGSSRIFRGLSPERFDLEMEKAGHPVKSFNFGLDAMTPLETRVVLEKIFATKPKRLKWIFVEGALVSTTVPPEDVATLRAIHWHGWRETDFVCRQLFAKMGNAASGNEFLSSLRELTSNLEMFFRNNANVGAGTEWFGKDKKKGNRTATLREGFAPLGDIPMPKEKEDQYRQLLADDPAKRLCSDKPSEEVLSDIGQIIKRHGATPIFLKPPTLRPLADWPPAGNGDASLNFSDPGQFPQLFDIKDRVGTEHLKGPATDEFTRLVAVEFSKLLQGNR